MSRLDGGILGLEGPGEVWHIVVSKGWGALGSCSIPLSQEVGIGCSISHAKEKGEKEEEKKEEEKKDQQEFEAS